jgi:hypothetical protein
MNSFQRILHRPFFIKLFNWEYWSFNAVYGWILPIWFCLCLRARSFFFFSSSNPRIENGGFLLESKMKIYDLIPPEYYPASILVKPGEAGAEVIRRVKERGIRFPLIAKPDIGARGRGVKIINEEEDLIPYLKHFPFDMVVQELVNYENEIGIFYYRYPSASAGKISGIVGKEFLSVKGDGVATVEELLAKNKRAVMQMPVLRKSLGTKMQEVLPAGIEETLVPYGNHARGSLFLDFGHYIDAELELFINKICNRIPDFYFGRLDIRYESIEALKQGKSFSIIELNGAGSEPTHMYDPKHGLFYAWKEIIRHWVLLWRISRQNHKRGIPYMSYSDGIKMHRDTRAYDKLLAQATEQEMTAPK